jgi:putative flippase GtrA
MSWFVANIFDRSLLRFIIAGIINTIIGSTIMFALYNIVRLSYWQSSICNYFFTSIFSFFLNKYFTFKVRHWSVFMVVMFVINIALCYLVAYGIAKPVVNALLWHTPQSIRENTALFAGMCLFTILNYLGQRLMVFKIKPE